jgi:hypothetical protein
MTEYVFKIFSERMYPHHCLTVVIIILFIERASLQPAGKDKYGRLAFSDITLAIPFFLFRVIGVRLRSLL